MPRPTATVRFERWPIVLSRFSLPIIGVATYAVYFVSTRRTFYFYDDFWWMYDTSSRPFGWENLNEGSYGHFAPVTRLGYYTVHALFGLRWLPASLIISALVVAAVVGVYKLARELGASSGFAAVGAAAFALSPVTLHVSQWWGGSMHIFGGLLGTTWTAIEFLRWQRSGLRRHYIASVVVFGCALVVQERPLLVIAALCLFAVFPPSKQWNAQRIGRAAASVLPHALLGVGYLAFYTTYYALPGGDKPSGPTFVRYLTKAAVENFGPLTAGLQPARLGGWAVVVGVAALSFWVGSAAIGSRRMDVRVGVLLIAGMWLLNFAVLAYGRLGINGTVIAEDLQYHVDALVWFVAPTMALLSRSTILLRFVPHVRPAALAAAALSLAAIFTWPSVIQHDTWSHYGRSTRTYMLPVSEGVEVLRSQHDRFDLLPMYVPDWIFPEWVPLDQPQLVGLFPQAPVPVAGAPTKFAFDATGRLREVQPFYVDVLDLTTAPHQQRASAINADVVMDERGVCATGTGADASFQVTLDPGATYTGSMVEIQADATVAHPGFTVSGNASNEYAYSAVRDQPSGASLTLWSYLRVENANLFVLSGPPRGETTCLERVAFLSPVAQPLPGAPDRCELLGGVGEMTPTATCGEPWHQLS